MKINVLAPAKINLSLDVNGLRSDGYHSVSTVMQAVSIYDEIILTSNDSGEITVSCDYPGVPCDETNIVYKAAVQFFNYTQIPQSGVHIKIKKIIPTQAGMGGGSSDGAAVLVGLNRMFDAHLKTKELCQIGERVGADVPFCINGGTQYGTGTGATLEKIRSMPRAQIVICKPQDVSVSTKEAYAKVDEMPEKVADYSKYLIRSIYNGDLRNFCATLYNDFEEALQIPQVAEIKKIMYQNKAKGALMTGSGSAVYGLFSSERHAKKCIEVLKENYQDVFLCKPVKDGCKIVSVDLD